MIENQLITSGKNPEPIPKATVYLTFLAEKIDSHEKSHYQDEHTNVPKRLAYKYLEFRGTYWEVMETCLRNFGEIKQTEFTDEYKEVALEIYEEELSSAVDDLLKFASDKIRGQSKKFRFKVSENAHAHPFILKLLKERIQAKDKRDHAKHDNHDEKEKSDTVSLLKLPKSTLTSFERKLINVAHKGLMEEALKFAERRAKLNGGIYKFKKLMHSLSDIYDDFIINSTTNKPKISIIEKEDSELIKHVTKNYEVIGNNTYLLNTRKYEKAVREHFVPKLKKARKNVAKL